MPLQRITEMLGCLFAAALVLIAPDGMAQSTGKPQAKLAAKAYQPLPNDLHVALDYREDSELNQRLRTIFERALTERGFDVSDAAEFVLIYETLIEEKLAADRPASVVGRGGSEAGSEIVFQFRLPLDKPKPTVGGRRYSLNVTLSRRGKPPIWVGSAVAVAAYGDRFTVQSAMVRAAVNSLGQTVQSRPIPVE